MSCKFTKDSTCISSLYERPCHLANRHDGVRQVRGQRFKKHLRALFFLQFCKGSNPVAIPSEAPQRTCASVKSRKNLHTRLAVVLL